MNRTPWSLATGGPPAGPASLWRAVLGATGVCLAAAALATALASVLDQASLVLVFLLGVVASGAWLGRAAALWAAGLSVLLFNFGFVPPRFSLSVADERLVFTFAVMLAVGLVVGQLTAGLKAQAEAAQRRAHQIQSLYDIARELGQALTTDEVVRVVDRFITAQGGARVALFLPGPDGHVQAAGEPTAAAWGWAAARAMGSGCAPASGAPSDGPPSALPADALVLPLRGTMAVRGALALRWPARVDGASASDRQQLIDTCAALVGSTLERLHYIEVARDSAVQIEGERLRNTVLAAISHDLRTPLASVVGLAESLALAGPPLTREQADLARAIGDTARRTGDLVANLLDMARLQAGAVPLDPQWQPAEEVIGAALSATAPLLQQHHTAVQVPADMPLVRIDAVLMERALVNLLENAAKYTPAGSAVRIEARVLPEAWQLRVEDNGPGLPAARRQDLLHKFERGDRESAVPGAGLGLALCSAIAEAHGGHFEVGEVVGGGASFVLQLPRTTPPPMPPGESDTDATWT